MTSFDVAIPNYNYGRYLRECVASVASQDVEALRILIIDNASTDDSARIAKEIADADPRVELRLRDRNLGPHASFNEAVDWASSDYFLILCTDDVLAPGALRRAFEVFDAEPGVAFCKGRDLAIHENGTWPLLPTGSEPARWTRQSGRGFIARFCRLGVFHVPSPTLIVRTSAHKQAGHYRSELTHTDDCELWLRLALLGDIAEIDNIQALSRYHTANRSHEMWARQSAYISYVEAAANSFFTHEGSEMPGAARLHGQVKRSLAARAYWASLAAWVRGEPDSAVLMKYALNIRPAAAILPPISYLIARPGSGRRIASALRLAAGFPGR